MIVGLIAGIYENHFRQDLLADSSLERLKKMNVSKLELKRYLKNTYLGSNMKLPSTVAKRKKIPLESKEKYQV